MKRLLAAVCTVGVMGLSMAGGAFAEEKVLAMSTTTSTENSGLLDVLLPEFKKDTGITVKVTAKGTGAAIRDGQDKNVEVIFVHAKAREEKFVADGYGTKRYAVMHNDFVILGPAKDPAGVKGSSDAAACLKKIADTQSTFISRGDDSGTHTKEQSLWKATGLEMAEKQAAGGKTSVQPAGGDSWYVAIGQGMGATLTQAEERQAYTLSDRGTYIKYKYGKTPALELDILCEGDESLANPYGVIPVTPGSEMAVTFAEWLVSPRGQKVIADYRLEGQQLFFPDAVK